MPRAGWGLLNCRSNSCKSAPAPWCVLHFIVVSNFPLTWECWLLLLPVWVGLGPSAAGFLHPFLEVRGAATVLPAWMGPGSTPFFVLLLLSYICGVPKQRESSCCKSAPVRARRLLPVSVFFDGVLVPMLTHECQKAAIRVWKLKGEFHNPEFYAFEEADRPWRSCNMGRMSSFSC